MPFVCSMTLRQVGEDYLMMLPECLSFISELMEDENAEIIEATSQFIRFVESLSGESLDTYLT